MGLFVAGAYASGTVELRTSPDGVTWTARTSNFGTSIIWAAAWSPDLRLFIVAGSSGTMVTSPDGVAWTPRTSGFDTSDVNGVAWSPSLGLFVAVGGAGKLATSPDGTTWTQRTSGFGTDFIKGVAWSPSLGLFVAVGRSGKIFTSPNGTTWTQRTSNLGSSTINDVAWSPSLGLFVAASDTGNLATSPDGTTWTARAVGFGSTQVMGVAWSPSLGLFVAVGGSGKIFTSANGTTTWTQRTSNLGTALINDVAWSPSIGLFVATSTAGKIATSPDGVTWTARTPFTSGTTIYAVTAGMDNKPPNAPILADVGGIDRAVTNRLPWTFSDDDLGDSQSKFDLRYRFIGAPTWTDVTGTTPNQFWDAPGGTFTAGDYEWQVRTYDSQGVVGPYSASGFFTAGTAPPNPTFTDPINGQTIGTASYTATISAPDVDASQWRKVADNAGSPDTGTIYADSGVIEGAVRSYNFSFPVNNRTEHLQVRIRDGGLWSQWADSRNPVSYTPPPAPTGAKTPVPSDGAIDLAITNPAPGAGEPATSYNDVYYAEPGEAEERKATLVPPNSTWRHWLPASDAVYTYRIVAVGSNGTTSETTVA